MAGEVRGTPRLVGAMVRELPEGSRYVAILSAPGERDDDTPAPDYNPEAEALWDRRHWTADRRLMAQQINALHQLIVVSGEWKKGKEPHFPVIGPLAWHPPEQRKEELNRVKKAPADVAAVMKALGWSG